MVATSETAPIVADDAGKSSGLERGNRQGRLLAVADSNPDEALGRTQSKSTRTMPPWDCLDAVRHSCLSLKEQIARPIPVGVVVQLLPLHSLSLWEKRRRVEAGHGGKKMCPIAR